MNEYIDKKFSEYMEEEYIKKLIDVKNGGYHTFKLDDNFYGFNFIAQKYYKYEYGLNKDVVEISKKDLIKKIDVYLRKYKLKKIMSKIK